MVLQMNKTMGRKLEQRIDLKLKEREKAGETSRRRWWSAPRRPCVVTSYRPSFGLVLLPQFDLNLSALFFLITPLGKLSSFFCFLVVCSLVDQFVHRKSTLIAQVWSLKVQLRLHRGAQLASFRLRSKLYLSK